MIRFLEYAIPKVPAHDIMSDWQHCLACAYSYRAEATDDLADWSVAVRLAEEALGSTFPDPEDADDVIGDLALFYTGRTDSLWRYCTLDEAGWLPHLDEVLGLLTALRKRAGGSDVQAAAATRTAHVLMLRWDFAEQSENLRRVIAVLGRALPLLPADDTEVPELQELFAKVCWYAHSIEPGARRLDAAGDAATSAVESAEPEEEASRNLLLAHLLSSRADVDEPAVRSRMIRCLSVAVTAQVDLELWELGNLLFDRGKELDDVADLRSAISWLEQELHALRLRAVFLDGKRPNLPEFAGAQPVQDWLEQAQSAAARTGDTPLEQVEAVLAVAVAAGWALLIPATPQVLLGDPSAVPVLFDYLVRLMNDSREIDSLPDEYLMLVDALMEVFTNLTGLLAGDTDVDLTKIRSILNDGHFEDLHDDFAMYIGAMNIQVGIESGSVHPMDGGRSLLYRRQDPEPLGLPALSDVVRPYHSRSDTPAMVEGLGRMVTALRGGASPTFAGPLAVGESMIQMMDPETSSGEHPLLSSPTRRAGAVGAG